MGHRITGSLNPRREAVVHRLFRIAILGSSVFLALSVPATAAQGVERVTLTSRILSEARPLNIALPTDYSPSKTYPVIYALDGGARHLPTLAERVHAEKSEVIVVGVENIDRTRDMFPEAMPEKDGRGGGGAKFLDFLVSELIPFVEARYATNGYRVLSGQSNSGFFVLYAMIHSPDAFDAYLASSPMIGWDWEMIRDGSTALFASRDSFPKALFMNRGESDYEQTTNFLPRYVELLGAIAPGDFRWKQEIVEGDGHVPENSYGNGIAFIFRGR